MIILRQNLYSRTLAQEVSRSMKVFDINNKLITRGSKLSPDEVRMAAAIKRLERIKASKNPESSEYFWADVDAKDLAKRAAKGESLDIR